MDYKVKDMALADMGLREIELCESEMAGLTELVRQYREKGELPLKGAKITGCLHMNIKTCGLMDALVDLGAEIRWSSCNIFSTSDSAAAAMVKKGVPVFAWKGMNEEEYWWCIEKTLWTEDGEWFPNLLLDDGGDLTAYVNEKYPEKAKQIVGVSEETTTGVHRLLEMAREGKLLMPAINVNDAVTKSKFDNIYGCRESMLDGIMRATNTMVAGKIAVVCGYGDVGKGCAQSFKGMGAQVYVTEVDPICAIQASMAGYSVKKLENIIDKADIIVTTTGNCDIVHQGVLPKVKSGVILCNIGHFDDEIDTAWLRENAKWTEIKPQVHKVELKNGKIIILLAEGRLVNLGCAAGHPPFVMSMSFTNQTIAQLELWKNRDNNKYERGKVYTIPKEFDEEVARLHCPHLGIELDKLTEKQAKYIGLASVDGPFKSEAYRY